MSGANISACLAHAMTLTRLAKDSKSPEMIKQHLGEIERLLEYATRNLEGKPSDRKTKT